MGTVVDSLVDRWTEIPTNDDGVTVTHSYGDGQRPVSLLQIGSAPASPWTSDFVTAGVVKVDDTHYESYQVFNPADEVRDSGDVAGGFVLKDWRTPLNWRMQIRTAATVREIVLDLWRQDNRKIELVSGQTKTGLQFKGRQPTGAGSRVNFTNTASLVELRGGHLYRFKWALSSAEATNWGKEGEMQLELPLSIGDTFQAWASYADTQPHPEEGIRLHLGQSIVLVTPAHGKWYHRAQWEGSKLTIEDAAAPA